MPMRKIYSTNDLLRKVIRNEEEENAYMAVAGSLTIGGIPIKIVIPAQDLSDGILSYTTEESASFRLTGISIHFSEPVIEIVSLYKDFSNAGYDTKIYSKETSLDGGVTGATDFCFIPDSDVIIQGNNGTQLKLEVTNNGLNGIAYAIIEVEVSA